MYKRHCVKIDPFIIDLFSYATLIPGLEHVPAISAIRVFRAIRMFTIIEGNSIYCN